MKMITLVTGGARSGKSAYALRQAMAYEKRAFIATAMPVDEEMEERITEHRRQRGESFLTLEESVDLAGAVSSLPDDIEIAVIDCLTVWLGNVMHDSGAVHNGRIDAFLETLENPPCDLVIVTNEVGMGIIPATPLGRQFRDAAGFLNQETARLADEVVLMVSGIPTIIKGEEE